MYADRYRGMQVLVGILDRPPDAKHNMFDAETGFGQVLTRCHVQQYDRQMISRIRCSYDSSEVTLGHLLRHVSDTPGVPGSRYLQYAAAHGPSWPSRGQQQCLAAPIRARTAKNIYAVAP